ncbi:MAG: LysM peptidoglycan-binding domain-containing protein [Candidatus Accumulibacter sp.]|jgi:hypothetical protein|nr:LysM peptidoglycan-binding domain-containing protein [Accumulibacter sp.]
MIRNLFTLVLTIFSLLSVNPANAAADAPLKLADAAPNRHVVVRGDTLWDISARFLQEPWRWPEIWRMNQAQIKNPHRIYPGDVIVLDRDASGQPLLRLESKHGSRIAPESKRDARIGLESRRSPQIYEEELSEAIQPISPNAIEPFIAAPLFVEQNTLQPEARIVATQEDRVFLGNGDTAYVEGADHNLKKWQVYRKGKALHDPENPGRVLGYEAFHLGSATQIRPGDPAIFEIDAAKQEMGYGDRLMPTTRPELVDYIPHAPDQAIDGRVVSIYGGMNAGSRRAVKTGTAGRQSLDMGDRLSIETGGRLSIVAINRGSVDGLEIGHVLALERNRVVEQRDENDRKESVVIPAMRFGLIFVFRTFENVAYALAVQSDGPILVNDFVRTP